MLKPSEPRIPKAPRELNARSVLLVPVFGKAGLFSEALFCSLRGSFGVRVVLPSVGVFGCFGAFCGFSGTFNSGLFKVGASNGVTPPLNSGLSKVGASNGFTPPLNSSNSLIG